MDGNDWNKIQGAAATMMMEEMREKMGELGFQQQLMGVPGPPLTIGGWQVKVTERIHPDIKFSLEDGEIHFTHDVGLGVNGLVVPVMMVNLATWRFLDKHVFRTQEGSFFRIRWADMPSQQFSTLMEGISNRARTHFYEAKALRSVLDLMRINLYKECVNRHMDPSMEKAHHIVQEANYMMRRIIEPSMWHYPIQLRVERQSENGVMILPLHDNSFPHEKFMEEFGHVIQAWEYAWRYGRPEGAPYELRSDDEPFPPDP